MIVLCLSTWWSGLVCDISDILYVRISKMTVKLIALYFVSFLPRTSKSCNHRRALTGKALLQLFWGSGILKILKVWVQTSFKKMVERLGKHWENKSSYFSYKVNVFECTTSKKNCRQTKRKGYRKKSYILLHTSNYMQKIIEWWDRKYV